MPVIVPSPKYFGSITAGDPLWIDGQVLYADPPSFSSKKNDVVSWIVDDDVVAGAWDPKYDQSLERIESGSDSGHLLWEEYPSELSGACFTVKVLVQIKTTPTGTFFLNILPDYETYNTGYGIALRPNTGHFDIVKMTGYESFTDLQTQTFTFDPDKWYLVLFMKDGDDLKAKIWEWMEEEEPGTWTVSTTDSTYSFTGTAATSLANYGTCEAYVEYWAMNTGDGNYPADPYDLDGSPITGDGEVEYGNIYISEVIIVNGLGGGYGAIDYSFQALIDIASTSLDQHSSGAVEYNSYYIASGPNITGDGDVDVDMSDLLVYHGLGGAQGGVICDCVVYGTGYQENLGSGEITWGSWVVDGCGNFGGETSYSSYAIAAEGSHCSHGDGVVIYYLSIYGNGTVGRFSSGGSNVDYKAIEVVGTGYASNAVGMVVYPSAAIVAAGLGAVIGNGIVAYATPELAAAGHQTPNGTGAIIYNGIDVIAFASNDQCYHKLLEFVR
jgi:hypothetical protein